MSVLIETEKCKGCGVCISLCPVQAISFIQNKAFIDQSMCNECLQCVDECPENAIHQISENEVHVEKREHSTPYSLHQADSLARQTFSRYKQKHQALEKDSMFSKEVTKVIENLFKVDSSFGLSRKGERIRHLKQRK